MEEELPPSPLSVDIEPTSRESKSVDVTLKRKTIHTNVTVVENATR